MKANNNGIFTSNLSKFYENFRAVNSLTIDANPGDIFGFLGPNGAGKTTTIRMLCRLLSPTSGYAKVAGLDIVKDSLKIRSIIGHAGNSGGLVVRILNLASAQKGMSSLPYRIQTNPTDNNKLIDVNVNLSDGASESANEIIDRFEEAGLQIHEIRRMGMTLEDVYFKLIEARTKFVILN
jgi:ABC-type oligopeptide transport system ATPase subunit